MKLKTYTVKDVMSWRPCYPPYDEEYVRKLFAGRRRVDALDILSMRIPYEDRLWAVLRPKLIPERILHEYACWCAKWTLKREREAGREPDPRSWEAIRIKRLWLAGKVTDEDLAAAKSAAWYAARCAVKSAAWYAARCAAWSAAESAARSAAWSAADSAARYAAESAAESAACKSFIRKLRSMLKRVA